jgi:HD-like signal output (HDOD) protein
LDLTALASRVRALPPLPDALAEVLVALQREQMPSHRCIQLIERDPALAAATLRLANSAFYGAPCQVHRVSDALRLVGLRSVASVLLVNALQRQLDPDACKGFTFQSYWQHALVSALAARALALRCCLDADAAYLSGLMHTVGQLVLAALLPGPMSQAFELGRQRQLPIEEAQRQVLGLSHRPVGALLLQRWHFPEGVVQVVAAEESLQAQGSAAQARLTRTVHTASDLARWLLSEPQLSDAMPPGALRDELPAELADRCRLLGLPGSEWPALRLQLHEAARSLRG